MEVHHGDCLLPLKVVKAVILMAFNVLCVRTKWLVWLTLQLQHINKRDNEPFYKMYTLFIIERIVTIFLKD